MIQDFKAALARYDFLVSLLQQMADETEVALKEDRRWFAVAPKIVRKFVNQAHTLRLLFLPRIMEYGDKEVNVMDLSSMYSVLRMQYETHATFFHFFIPCNDIEENMLRFRLWELNGLQDKLNFKKESADDADVTSVQQDENYINHTKDAIGKISFFKLLPQKQQDDLLRKALWKFTSFSLTNNDKSKWGNSFEKLILNTGIKEDIYSKLYSFLSTHTHPHYAGVIQNYLSEEEEDIGCYVAVMYGCFVTAFLIEDFCKRFVQPKDIFEKLSKADLDIFESLIKASRN